MSYLQAGAEVPGDVVCQYAGSQLWFRGPKRSLNTPYVACVGGDETYGRFVDRPYTAVLEHRVQKTCVNFGSLFCGLEALRRDVSLTDLINGAELCVLQTPDVLGQTNRFYRVHPRRNDRFVEPTRELFDLYPEEDFTDIHFVRHLICRLHAHRDARFGIVAEELRRNWVRGLAEVLGRIVPPVILLTIDLRGRPDEPCEATRNIVGIETSMIDPLRPFCAAVTRLTVRVSGDSEELEDMLFGTLQQPVAEHLMGPAAHRSIAEALLGPVQDLI